jgi:glycosyltransferase involved in cell wall biosynthesis
LHKQRVNGNILFLSNLLFSKGILDFLKSLKVLKESGKIFSARIIGDETSDLSSKELNQFICDYGLEHCVGYFGAKFNEEKEMEFIKSSIFVFPTQNETFGLVNLEAMKYSLPIVSTNEGAIPDIISDNESGFLVGKGNYLELSDKIGFLLDNPKVASKMGIAGNKILQEKFTKVIFEEKIKNMFDDILCAE